MTGILVYPSWILSGVVLVLLLLGFKAAQVPIRLSSNRVRFLILFSLVLLLFQVILIQNGTILAYLIPRIGNTGPLFPITDFGLARGLSISVRFLVIIFSSMLFVSVTDPTLLAHSLTKLGIPYRYSFALVIALRFLPIFDMETNQVRMAQKSRGISTDVGGLRKIMRSIRYTFFPLLVSALSRIDTLSLSMDGRGFGYQSERTYLRSTSWKISDFIVIAFSIFFTLFCVLLVLGYLPQISAIL
jgi:energy-coupling factor transport system permease protein